MAQPASPPVQGQDPGLAENSVGFTGVFGQSLSAIGLSGVAATTVPIVAIQVGVTSWLVWVFATVVILLVALSIAYLSRRYATTGGLYGLMAAVLGPYGALLTGWLMVVMLGIGNGGATLSAGVYLGNFLQQLGIPYNRATLLVCSIVVLVVCWYLTHSGAKVSARVMFLTELVTTAIILVLFAIILFRHSELVVDATAVDVDPATFGTILTATVLATGAFTGFESATVFGREAKNPRRAIPLAMVLSVVTTGIVWMIASYVIVLGFGNSITALSQAPAPLSTLAEKLGMGWYATILDLAIAFTIAALVMATMSWLTRMMLTMSRENVAPAAWRVVDPARRTPKRALRVVFAIWLVEVLVMGSISDTPLTIFGAFLDTLTGLPALLVYALISIAAVVHQWRSRHRLGAVAIAAILGAIAMLYILYTNLNPWPSFPENLVVVLFVVAIVAVTGYYLWLRKARPARLAGVGSSVRSDTLAADEESPLS